MENRGCSGSSDSGKKKMERICSCPFCDNPVEMTFPFCQACRVALAVCKECNKLVAKEDKVCPNCGAELK